jgi:hydrogenase nickel incorporation protein HypA/HybF
MHEASLICGVMRIVAAEARRHGVARVRRVTLRIGILRAVEPQALLACFDAFAEGTLAEGAELAIISVPARLHCTACGHEAEVNRYQFRCTACGGDHVQLSGGQDLALESFES